MQSISSDTSNKLANMSFICALLVVVIHTWEPAANSNLATKGLWRLLCIKGIAVPYFFVVSGYLMAGHFHELDWWKSALRKRLSSLVVPCLLWSGLWLLYGVAVACVGNLMHARPISEGISLFFNFNVLLRFFAVYPLDHPYLPTLWYVRALLIFCFVSPLLYRLIRKNYRFVLLLTFLFWSAKSTLRDDHGTMLYFFYNFLGLGLIFFYVIGIAWRMGYISLDEIPKPRLCALLGYILLLSSVIIHPNHALPKVICYFADKLGKPLFICGIWAVIPANQWKKSLTSSAFGIYLIHWFVMDAYSRLFYRNAGGVVELLARAMTGIVVSLLVIMLLRRYSPRIAKLAFGGR